MQWRYNRDDAMLGKMKQLVVHKADAESSVGETLSTTKEERHKKNCKPVMTFSLWDVNL